MSRAFCETWDSTPHPSEDLGSATHGKATTSAAPQALSKSCHSERRKIIRKADDLAESRNPLSVDTITNRGAPFFAHFAKSGIPQPHPSEHWGSATIGKATTSVVPQALSKSCHSERRKIIRKADDLAEPRNLL
jgi:hypothetical protein